MATKNAELTILLDLTTEPQGSAQARVDSSIRSWVYAKGSRIRQAQVDIDLEMGVEALPFDVDLQGQSRVTVEAAGSLGVDVALAGAATVHVDARGALEIPQDLTGSITVSVSGAGALEVERPLSGASEVSITGSGTLEVEKRLSGTSRVSTRARGNLEGGYGPEPLAGMGEEVGDGLVVVSKLKGNLLPLEASPVDPSGAPPDGRGVVFTEDGSVWIWNASGPAWVEVSGGGGGGDYNIDGGNASSVYTPEQNLDGGGA